MQNPWVRFWIAIGVLACIGLIAGCWQSKGLFSQETAAWVQALGSIAAIGAGFGVAAIQSDNARRLELEAKTESERSQRAAAFTLAVTALAQFDVTVKALASGKINQLADIELLYRATTTLHKQLEAFDVPSLKRLYLMRSYLAFVGTVGSAADNLWAWRQMTTGDAPGNLSAMPSIVVQNIRKLQATALANFADFRRELEKLDGAYGDDGPIR